MALGERLRKAGQLLALVALGLGTFWAGTTAQEPEGMMRVDFRDFSGGLNDTADPVNLQPNQSPAMLNVVIDDPVGSLRPRNGFTLCGDFPQGTPTNAFEFSLADGTKRLIVTDNQYVYETRDCQTWTLIADSLSASQLKTFAMVRDKLWVVGRDTHPFTWDGTNFQSLDGSANTPNPPPPDCGYIEFFRERAWCARTNSSPSSVAFSAITDTSGNDLDPSTGTASWPATNVVNVDQDGGCPIYGIKSYRDNLFVFKGDCGIWRIAFESEFNIAVIKTMASIGSRFHESIVEVDGLLHFVGPDGIYAFDGQSATRISTNIEDLFGSLNQPLANLLSKSWTSSADFGLGAQQLNVDTGTLSGSALVGSTATVKTGFSDLTNGQTFISTITNGYRFSSPGNSLLVNSGRVEVQDGQGTGNFILGTDDDLTSLTGVTGRYMEADVELQCCAGNNDTIALWFLSDSTNSVTGNGYALTMTQDGTLQVVRYDAGSATEILDLDSDHPGNGVEVKYRMEWSTGGVIEVFQDGSSLGTTTDTTHSVSSGALFVAACGSLCDGVFYDDIQMGTFFTSATWTSAAFNAVTVSSWSTLDVTAETNGLTPTYAFRAATSEANLAKSAFKTIPAGAVISTGTDHTWIQVRVQADNQGIVDDIQLDDITVSYTQSGTQSQNLFASAWNNQYWVSAASGSATTNNVALVRSRFSPAWMVHNLQIGPMVKFSDRFYAASSTSTAIYRLDFGTNDNGAPIEWYWTSREETWGEPYRKKELQGVIVEYRKDSAQNAYAGYVRGDDILTSTKTVDMSGTGRGTKRLYIDGGVSHGYRLKVGGGTIDEKATIMGLSGIARPLPLME